jgi:HSP20 family protein
MNTILRYNSPVESFSNIIDSLLNSKVLDVMDRNTPLDRWPKVDITETGDGYTIKADLPGIEKSEVKIVVEDGVLRIEGDRKDNQKKEENMYSHLERSYGKFSRSFALPEEIDPERLEAKMTNGVLTISLSKVPKAKPKKIDIRIE